MASKGQKLRTYAPETKGQILKEYLEENVSSSYLAKKYGVPRCTIKNWVRKAKHGIDVKTDHRPGRSGRPKTGNLTLEDYRERYEILKKYRAFLQARRGKK